MTEKQYERMAERVGEELDNNFFLINELSAKDQIIADRDAEIAELQASLVNTRQALWHRTNQCVFCLALALFTLVWFGFRGQR